MNNKQVTTIKDAINLIDEQIKDPISLNEISKVTGISKCHLHRLFKAVTGKSLIAYARGRKLSQSLHELLNTNMTVLEVACEYSFEYEQSYIRSFLRQFNITPAQYRQLCIELPIVQKIDVNSFVSINDGLILEPKMIIKPGFFVQGIKEEIVHSENFTKSTANSLAQVFFDNYLSQIDNKVSQNVYIGLVTYLKKRNYSNNYMPCTETSVLNISKPPLESKAIPMNEYAVFKYVGLHSPNLITYKSLLNLYHYIFKDWLPKSSYMPAASYHFEKLDLDICSKSYCEMDIYVPIQAKK